MDALSDLVEAMGEAITATVLKSRRKVWADGTTAPPAVLEFYRQHEKILNDEDVMARF